MGYFGAGRSIGASSRSNARSTRSSRTDCFVTRFPVRSRTRAWSASSFRFARPEIFTVVVATEMSMPSIPDILSPLGMLGPAELVLGLLRRRPEDSLSDDQLLNLVRPFVEPEDAGVAEVPLHIEIPAEPVAPVDLDRSIRHPHRHLRAEQLCHRDLLRVVDAEVPEVGGPQGQEARRVDLRGGLRNHLPDQLEVADGAVEGLPCPRVRHGRLE